MADQRGGEVETLRHHLDGYRSAFEKTCEGLSPEQLATRSVPPSTMSLLGLVRHLAEIERHWFRRKLGDQPQTSYLYFVEGETDRDFEGAVATNACVAEAWQSWRDEVEHAREVQAGYDDLSVGGESWQARGIVVHMIEEYARHCGHADLLRECIDGRTSPSGGPVRRP